MNVHEVIDRFVHVASSVGVPFAPLNDAAWIEQFESKLPARLPPSFRSLIARYSFPAFDVASLALFANRVDAADDELSNAVFRDKAIAEVTQSARYIQFARPADGSYDPVCFNANDGPKNREFPIVRLDHEAILLNSRIVVRETIENSFLKFVQAIIASDADQHRRIISLIEQTDY